jgi:Xaa-Pro aminopeptidase
VHLERTLAAMTGRGTADDGIDVLLLGREANARYVSGAERLWLAGTRPFAPGCAVVRETGAVHLLSITDDGIPGPDARDRLYPMSWNPATTVGAIVDLPGVAAARRIGLDGITPMFEQLLTAAFPTADLVDGEALLRAVRRVKSPSDVAAIRAACDAAAAALSAVVDALTPGTSELELKSVFEARMTDHGLTAPAFEPTCCIVEPGRPVPTFPGTRVVRAGDLVQLRAGVMRAGWEGLVSTTLVCGGEPPRSPRVDDVRAACVAGVALGAVRGADTRVEGTGMGHEELDDADVLEPGMVLAIDVIDGDVLDGAVVHVTTGEPDLLTVR